MSVQVLRNLDLLALESAFQQLSDSAETAAVDELVRLAADEWGYPGTIAHATLCLLHTGRYEVDGNLVHAIPCAAISADRSRKRHSVLA